MNDDEYYTFGWHGISFDIPVSWELGKETGTAGDGYVRIDDMYLPRVEVTWKKPNKKYKLKTIYDNYIRNLKKKIRKRSGRKAEIDILHGFVSPPSDREMIIFRWEEVDSVYECVSFCRECYRLVFVRYITHEDSEPVSRAKRLFESLQDHSTDGKSLWSFLGLHAEVPGNLSLENTVLNAGFIRLDFADRDDCASVIMISLARELTEKRSLDDIIWIYCKKDLKKYRGIDFQKETVRGHNGVIGIPEKKQARFFKPLFPEKGYMRIYGWMCEQKNKIFIVKAYSMSEQGLDETASIHRTIACH